MTNKTSDKTIIQLAIEQESDRRWFQKQAMHKYVWVCVGVFFLFLATFPTAYWRVSQSEKYNGGPFKSLDWEDSQRPKITRASR